MSETGPTALPPAGGAGRVAAPFSPSPSPSSSSSFSSSSPPASGARAPVISFSRHELNEIFSLYGHMVATGEWRDYAIDMLRDRAVFSVFRRAAERPLYVIEKRPQMARRQGAYCVVAMTGLVLRRGHDLSRVLRVLRPRPRVVRA